MKLANKKNSGFDWNRILEFCKKYIRYISAGVIVVILVIVLAVTGINGGEYNSEKEAGTSQEQAEEFAVDAIPEINTLIENYYTAYAAGDFTALEACATPVSEIEKSYIAVVNEHITGYKNIQCYTKSGLAEGEYAVSVVVDLQYADSELTAPGVDFFYVRTNENGAYYIDNLYSSRFNLAFREQELDSKVDTFIAEYESQNDVLDLLGSVQAKCDTALEEDAKLKEANDKLVLAVQAWLAEITDTGEEQPEEATQPEGTAEGEQQTGEQPEEEATEPNATVEGEQQTEEPQPDVEAEGQQQEATAETVYVIENVNIREEPNESADKVDGAVAGQSFTRTGTTDDGWSEIEYNGSKAYIKSEYLSTEAPDGAGNAPQGENGTGYVPEGTVIVANQAYNIRESMSEDGERVGTTDPGDEIKVVLSYEEGWTKVEWKDKTGYIKTDLLLNN